MSNVKTLVSELEAARGQLKRVRVELKNGVAVVKDLRLKLQIERRIERQARQGLVLQRKERAAARKAEVAAKRAERIAALEAKLEALRAKALSPKALKKAARQASPVKLISKDAA